MAKIPQAELEQLKRGVDLVALVRSKGIELKPHGAKDLVGLSPFTDEKTPSFIVTPGKNLWHCMSSGQGGSVIDFVMKHDGVSFWHAALLLQEQNPQLFGGHGAVVKKSTARKLAPPVDFHADDQTLFHQVLDYYHGQLKQSPMALEYLSKRGLACEEAMKTFRLGYADRSLGLRLPHQNRRDGQEIRERLKKLGILRQQTGHEHFNGCVVFPVITLPNNDLSSEALAKGEVSEIYGRKINDNLRAGTVYHLYLPGPHRGIWNPACLNSPEIILCESVIDALTWWVHGYRNVTCIYGTEGINGEHIEAFRSSNTQCLRLAYDNDDAGNRAAKRDAERFLSLGIDCFRVKFPPGMDANSFALKVTPANKSLHVLLQGSEWLGKAKVNGFNGHHTFDGHNGHHAHDGLSAGAHDSLIAAKLAANVSGDGKSEVKDDTDVKDEPEAPEQGGLRGEAAKGKKLSEGSDLVEKPEAPEVAKASGEAAKAPDCGSRDVDCGSRDVDCGSRGAEVEPAGQLESTDPGNRQSPVGNRQSPIGVDVKHVGEDVVVTIGERQWRVRGLAKNTSFEVLKVNLRLLVRHSALSDGGLVNERFHLDTLDFYRARERSHFVASAAAEVGLTPDLIKRDLGKVLFVLEDLQQKRILEALQPKEPEIKLTDEQHKAALELLTASNLVERISQDLALTVVGETSNNLVNYLAAVSRKLDKPLGVIIQSSSAAGKTSLMEAVLRMMPEEDRVKYSAMTGQSLYYLGEKNLKHKILAIVEEEGAEKASYALKLLLSEGELTIASTGKDEQGRMKTEEYRVEGPVMIFLTTTAIDIDPELLNRCLVVAVDESREQTSAIHVWQREEETLEGQERKEAFKRVIEVHQNAQRLLKPVRVVNPFARHLTFLNEQTRTRRDHKKYLTLIRTIALLHQYQRPMKERKGRPFIEVTIDDIETANQIAHDVLGRSLDELPPQTRRLLTLLRDLVRKKATEQKIAIEDVSFTRRDVRAFTGWSNTQLKVHLDRLADLEYLVAFRGGHRGALYEYELLFDGDVDSAKPHFCGLLDVKKLREKLKTDGYDEKFAGSDGKFAGSKRPQNGSKTGGLRGAENASEPSNQAASEPDASENGENEQEPPKKTEPES